jgi:ribonuclease Z
MRVSFMGTSFLPRLSQAANSVFVECGNGENFVFDCGAGVIEKFVAAGVAYSQMDKILLTHLHADHMSDLMFIYCFVPSTDRFTPQYVWGPTGPSTNAPQGAQTNEGTVYFCDALKKLTKWHRESFSFLSTGLTNGLDGYDLVPCEIPYEQIGYVVYNTNGVKITSFPAIHERDGAISYRLEWAGLVMVFSGDTRPNTFMLSQATNLDVLVHEVTVSPEVWATKITGLHPGDPGYSITVDKTRLAQDCSHTPAKALGYILHQLELSNATPRLAVATHCQFEDDTTNAVWTDIRSWYTGDVAFVKDFHVITVSTDKSQPIRQGIASFSSNAFYAHAAWYELSEMAPPKYTNNMMQLSVWLQGHIIPTRLYSTLYADADMDGDGLTDPVIYDPNSGTWGAMLSGNNYSTVATVLGGAGYTIVPGDYDWDRQTDPAVYRDATGDWFVQLSGSGYQLVSVNFGGPGFTPAQGDFDGDRKADPAAYQENTGLWGVQMSGSAYALATAYLGGPGCKAVPRNYDGDGKTDPAVYQESTGFWGVMLSASGYQIATAYLGGAGCYPAPGDYDGDGLTDLCVYQENTGLWGAMLSMYGYGMGISSFGGSGYAPVPGDFDGDLKTDLTAYQALSGLWYSMLSGRNYGISSASFGGPLYLPVWGPPSGL